MEKLVADGFLDMSKMLGPGVYALVFADEVIYIGKARRLLHRIYAHRNLHERMIKSGKVPSLGYQSGIRPIKFSRVWIFPCQEAQLDLVETQLIRKYQPSRNIKGVSKVLEGPVTLNLNGMEMVFNGPPLPKPVLEPIVRRF